MSGLHYLFPIAVLVYELVVLRHSPEMSVLRAILVLALLMILQAVPGVTATMPAFLQWPELMMMMKTLLLLYLHAIQLMPQQTA